MAIPPIPPTSAISSLASTQASPTTSPVGDSKFNNVFSKLINEANDHHVASEQAVRQLASGQTDSLHDVVMSVAKADMSFRLVLEIRNRLIEAYQEVMRMQV